MFLIVVENLSRLFISVINITKSSTQCFFKNNHEFCIIRTTIITNSISNNISVTMFLSIIILCYTILLYIYYCYYYILSYCIQL